MPDLINALPGIEMPVGEVTRRLATMWETGPGSSPADFRASQMNVVLHFGLEVGADEGRARFDALIRFAQRYPSRIIVLCPSESHKDGSMTSKLFSQCYIGESHREMCCCEALLLSYKSEDYGYLSNQVSVWLEGDLPTYHWFHGVPARRIEKYFDDLLVGVRRILYDSSIEPKEVQDLDWPLPERVNDLAKARLLTVRQAIGQYLSGYSTDCLCDGLQSVVVSHAADRSGEAVRLLEWVRDCLNDCEKGYSPCVSGVDFQAQSVDASFSLLLEFKYDSEDRYFRWSKNKEDNLGTIEAKLGKVDEQITTRIKAMSEEQAIAEALFF